MTSDAQMAANRRNAKMSFGPLTRAGKAVSSRNARTHGATAAPFPGAVAQWYRVILDDPLASPSHLISLNREARLALALAEAEVQLQEVQAAVDAHIRDCLMARRSLSLQELIDQNLLEITDDLFGSESAQPQERWTPERLRELDKFARQIIRSEPSMWRQAEQQGRLLRRYAREAESRRARAFQAWVACRAEQAHSEEAPNGVPPKRTQSSISGCGDP